jgi:predicted CopG family antitoxin
MQTADHKSGLTVRLAPEAHRRLVEFAAAEKRSVSAFLERLVEREIAAREEAERVIRVYIAPELVGKPFGDLIREKHETDAAFARRQATMNTLFGG